MKLAELTAATGIEAHTWDDFVEEVKALDLNGKATQKRLDELLAQTGPQEPGPAAVPSGDFVHMRQAGDGRTIITSA